MSGATGSNIQPIIVYVKLLDEGTVVYRPAKAEPVGYGELRLLAPPGYDPEDEHWEFPPGTIVRCETRKLAGSDALVAVAAAD
jgi:hypothetical protein